MRFEQAQRLGGLVVPLVQRHPRPPSSVFGQRTLVLDNAGRPHETPAFHQQAATLAREHGEHASAAICLHNMAVGYFNR